jgi:hypothetical protein
MNLELRAKNVELGTGLRKVFSSKFFVPSSTF